MKIFDGCSDNHEEIASSLSGHIECDSPNKKLERFEGTLYLNTTEQIKIPLVPRNILLRGCQLRNTDWTIGVVVYAGHESKIQMNSAASPFKVSSVMKETNRFTLYILSAQLSFCLYAAIASTIFVTKEDVKNMDYLWAGEIIEPMSQAIFTFFTTIILFTNFIPISLLVTVEMVKFFQAMLMMMDRDMYHRDTDTPMKVRCSDLNEELGTIKYVFSDKTGTLTCNVMEFRKCSIGGIMYGQGLTEVGKSNLVRLGKVLPPDPVVDPNDPITPNVNFVDPELWNVLRDPNHPNHTNVFEFFFHLAINHSVMPEVSGDDVVYSASSPDEGALVYAARHFGFKFHSREPKSVTISINGIDQDVSILHVLEFSSERKRSSVVCQKEDGSIVLYCKGADNVIKSRLTPDHDPEVVSNLDEHLTQFCDDGLRTLCIARVDIEDAFYRDWAARYHEAETAMDGRESRMSELMDEIEQNLTLLGSTAIEDKLQDGVSDAISSLRKGGVKVWVLTGDKVDTAVNIGFACSLLTNEMNLFYLTTDQPEIEIEDHIPTRLSVTALIQEKIKEIGSMSLNKESAVIIDTGVLESIMENDLGDIFLQLAENCKSVVCARVSPDQKGQVVTLVRNKRNAVTLAIGDGANDVNMIQKVSFYII